ncbi:biotin/lipoyl-containing protein [Lutispora thermophila]|uniref:Biotin-requiring enzyme n=1 Tax=Lutispora thermophila DSM 19022 TaxID=1122184 RepID=A0A1M6IDS6_9FIRM|nr:biotin/lipoyl-containing protein [Lutispora thermophila]SHJ32563.1 Biotin-requiring enzyme [Lutispora thermophila DSM 19022]
MLRRFNININGKDYIVKMEEIGAPQEPVQIPVSQPVPQSSPKNIPVATLTPKPQEKSQSVKQGEGVVVEAPMPGTILQVMVKVGDRVEIEQSLVILEAMKMENEIVAPKSGTIAAIHVTSGSAIDVGQPMITIV